jgi:transcription initiation factor TFIIB
MVCVDDEDVQLWNLGRAMRAPVTNKKTGGGCAECCDGTLVCDTCGMVSGRVVSSGQEWRAFPDATVDPCRCGMPLSDTSPMGSISTFVARAPGSQSGRVSLNMIWNSEPYREKALRLSLTDLSVIAANAGLSSAMIADAKAIFVDSLERTKPRGPARVAALVVAMYLACKRGGVPRSIKEMAHTCNIDANLLTVQCKRMQEALGLQLRESTPLDYVRRSCARLGLEDGVVAAVSEMVLGLQARGRMSDFSPQTVVAGCIHAVCRERLTKKAVSAGCGVSMATLTKCCGRLVREV